MTPHLPDYIAPLLAEAHVAAEAYGNFASTHEAIGVLVEEMRELMDALREHSLEGVTKESLQVAAVAFRLHAQCQEASESFRERSRLK